MLPRNKQSFLTILFILISVISIAQEQKEKDFIRTLLAVEMGFSRQDSIALLKHINKDIGLYQIDRVGVFDHYNHVKNVSFNNLDYPKVLFKNARRIEIMKLSFEKLPSWDCVKEAWSKMGCFADSLRTDHLLSSICKWNNRYHGNKISNKTIKAFYELESISRRVVVFDTQHKELVCYLSFIAGSWYFTMLDYASSDCSV
jgi:hypothetical protein